MNGTLSTPGTSQMPWEPDTSLLDAAREIAPIIRAHSEEAERERRLSQPALKALRETGLLRMTTPRSLGGLETDPVTRALVGEEIGRHDSAAAWTVLLLDTLSEAWRRCVDGETHSLEQKADLLLAMAHAMSSAVQAVELACSIAGTTAFRASSPLERCFRDVQTMRHHVFASEQRYGTFGQVCLGVPPDFPVVAF